MHSKFFFANRVNFKKKPFFHLQNFNELSLISGENLMRIYSFYLVALLGSACLLQSCARNGSDVWEDTKSAGRHMNRGVRALGGKHGDSRQIHSKNDFECVDDEYSHQEGGFQDCDYSRADFIPLQDQANNEFAMADILARQPRETPGEIGSSIPSIESFQDPCMIPQLAAIFKTIYFDYDSSMIKGQANLQTIHQIADFMRRHPNVYIFIEGHTDERGPQAYNLALGSRRSNAVRNLLISEDVNPDNLFTISYGKERPVVLEKHEEGWSRNRRVEFKIYER
ncbi:putative peptidoglycan-associated lipoprotein (Pal) [Candidatus Protochlamydia amoebophila]|uniref:Peptidoglycan-associated protein n=2 Tax=Parachlamydiaceae TaxID=92713 RepID=A0A0C1JUB4_9BACT|nr:putative peptidoglycan-associated lipoprotein (Pal) [Candidatus Protochlamydia amoebophila]